MQQQNQNQVQMGMGMPNVSPPSAPAPAPISVAPQPTQGFQGNFPGTPPAMPPSMPVPQQQQQQMVAPDPSHHMPPTMPVSNSPPQRVGGTQPPALDTNFHGQGMVNGMVGGMGTNQNNAQMQMIPSQNAGSNSVQQPPQQQPSQNGFQAKFQAPTPAPVPTNGAATNQMPTSDQEQEFNDIVTNNATSTSSDPFDAFNSLAIDSSSSGKSASASTSNQQNSGSMKGGSDPSLGDKNHESKYSIGQTLEYRDSQQTVSVVKVLRVHLDDNLVPFYDVHFENGREKQTDDGHLRIPGMHDQSISNTGNSMMNGMAAGSMQDPSDPIVKASHVPKELMIQKINELLQNLSQEQLQNVESYIKST